MRVSLIVLHCVGTMAMHSNSGASGIGGVMIAARNCISSSFIPVDSVLEILWVTIRIGFPRCLVGTCSRPPDSHAEFVAETIDNVQPKFPNMSTLLVADFNYLGIDWAANEVFSNCTNKSECLKFLEMTSYFQFCQIVTTPTHGDALLDFVLTTRPKYTSVNVIDKKSDHCIVRVCK